MEVYVEAKIRYKCAEECGLPNEHLVFTSYDPIGGYVDFTCQSTDWTARLNSNGKSIRKGSVRRVRA